MDALKRALRRAAAPVLHPALRLTRGQTLGVRCAAVSPAGEVVLVRHGYAPGWSFPGGGVERRETLLEALARELREETGIILDAPPRLHGIFANFAAFPGDHVAFYVAENWRQPEIPKPNFEIAECRSFARAVLPDNVTAGTRRRLAELFDGADVSETW